MFKDYNEKIGKTLNTAGLDTDWKSILENHKTMIALIQHERLVHLLITIFVGISMLLTSLTTIITEKPILIILDIPLICLFFGYILHYRFLENTTQSWYKLAELIKGKIH